MNPAPEIYEGLTAFVQRKDYILVRWEARMQNAVAFFGVQVYWEEIE